MGTIAAPDLPPAFVGTVSSTWGPAGEAWLADLPRQLTRLARRWSLTLQSPFAGLSYNYVAPARRRDGTPVVLKLGVPRPELEREIRALACYDGQGSVQLLAAAPDEGALLLERLRPGRHLLAAGDDDIQTEIAAGVMRHLWRPAPDTGRFKPVAEWIEGLGELRRTYGGSSGPLPGRLVDLAEGLFTELSASMDQPVLIHGDLHHFNLLSARRAPYLAIDPKGMVAEAAYDTGALLRNPMPAVAAWPDLERVMNRRVAILADQLDLDRRRIVAWGVAQAVLSGWWMLEDHGGGWEPVLRCAEALAKLL